MTALRFSYRSLTALALLAGLAVAGCDHVTEPDGPNLTDRFGPFAIVEGLDVDRDAVDFAAGERATFTGRFNKQVDWVIEITGQESGAVKRIEGFSSEISDENAVWSGGTTELPFFKTEAVEAELFVPAEAGADTTRTALQVLTPRVYSGEVITGFEEDDEARIFLGNFEFDLDLSLSGIRTDDEEPAAQGDRFYRLNGTDRTLDNFFVGLAQFTAPAADDDGYFEVPTAVPEDLYFNAFLNAFGTENTIIVLELATDTNGNGTFNDGIDAIFASGPIVLEQTGWVAFSRSMAEFGMNQEQAEQIVAVRAVLISDNNMQPDPRVPVDFGIDYITLTAGGPLEL